jgi:ATP-dependent Clp protease ATP-binding subunit ClpC
VLVLAQEEARLLNHNFIGTEHILLGLIHEGEGVAAKALESLGISLEAVREKVEETIGPAGSSPTGSPPFTPRAKKVLELSLREALQLGYDHIGTEHILLGVVRVGDSVAAQALVALGTDLSQVRAQVIRRMSIPSGGVITAAEVELRLSLLAEQVRELSDEVARLRGLLRQRGREPGEGTA